MACKYCVSDGVCELFTELKNKKVFPYHCDYINKDCTKCLEYYPVEVQDKICESENTEIEHSEKFLDSVDFEELYNKLLCDYDELIEHVNNLETENKKLQDQIRTIQVQCLECFTPDVLAVKLSNMGYSGVLTKEKWVEDPEYKTRVLKIESLKLTGIPAGTQVSTNDLNNLKAIN